METHDDLRRENEALRARISALSAASLRISASLDLATVLNEVVESARALTGARFGAIATIDEAGAPQDFVTSGFTEAEHQRLAEWSDGPRLFEHFRDLEGPLRISDVPAYVPPLGFPTDRLPSKTFQGTPMRHRGVHVGNFYLVEKEGGEAFTDEDEEILVLFASQAATAIANARTYRAEQRVRADLEALIETSPVGVVVFDVGTGHPVSLNREARRIVDSLRMPGHTAEDLLGILTCRFADGREIMLDEFPLAQALSGAETVRAEEIVLSVRDGRSVTILVNATPIHAEDGAVASVVVTMQDLAPLLELERMRAEFLGMVSHELRTPLAAIKGSTTTVLGAARLVAPAETRQFFRIIDEQADRMNGLLVDLLDAGRIDEGTLSVSPEPSEVGPLVDQARNTFLSGDARHAVLIDLPHGLPPVLAERQRIVQVLNNLLSNAARHSPETAPIRIAAERATGCMSRCRSQTREGALRRSNCHGCSRSTAVAVTARAGSVAGWDSPSARVWWRPTGGASGPRAAGWARALGSPSRSRWPKKPAPRTAPGRAGRQRRARSINPRASWWWTTTRRRCATSATRSRTPATTRWSRASMRTSRASSGPRSPGSSCST